MISAIRSRPPEASATSTAPARIDTGKAPSWIQPRSFGLTFSCSSVAACMAASTRSPVASLVASIRWTVASLAASTRSLVASLAASMRSPMASRAAAARSRPASTRLRISSVTRPIIAARASGRVEVRH